MPLFIISDDITRLKCDAIVNAANNSLLGGGGVDGAIHRAAGPKLLEECRTLNGCDTGDAKITSGYDLPSRYVIHTVGPVWHGGSHGEKQLLTSCYRRSLEIAASHECATVAFPMISAGVYGYPFDQALDVAVDTISGFLNASDIDMTVYLVIFSRRDYRIDASLLSGVTKYIEAKNPPVSRNFMLAGAARTASKETVFECCDMSASPVDDYIDSRIDESFTQMLLRKIDEKGITDVECYKKANVDRKLFSKIRSNKDYHPRKRTALGFAVSLKLDLEETKALLMKAGYALSDSNKGDLVVEYFITKGIYDINKINEVLFAMDQEIIGDY